jgi:UDP-N-acetylglucosamine--N-acetylmuramyl-(pentapeptide) pyrophosphoryl-undecaprenol N-acetylglucosamine transferase
MSIKKTILLAAGGTGGHVFPALTLAHALQAQGFTVQAITDPRGAKYWPASTVTLPVHIIQAGTPFGSLKGRIKALIKLGFGALQALWLVAKHRPCMVVGFGGYPSFAPVFLAQIFGIPTVLHEQNRVFGRASRAVATKAKAVATSFADTLKLPASLTTTHTLIHTGNPIRPNIAALANQPYPAINGPINLLITGGSQGSALFGINVPQALSLLPPELRQRLVVQHQCRAEDIEQAKNIYAQSHINATIAPFFSNMVEALVNCHLFIGRAGASTVAELTAVGRPAIFVPLGISLDGDQAHNAAYMADAKSAWILAENAFTPASLAAMLQPLLTDMAQLNAAAANAHALGLPSATQNLAELVLRHI